MELVIYAIRDVVAGVFRAPFAFAHQVECIRAFGKECCNPDSELFKYGADFQLWQVGRYNCDTGLTSNEHVLICTANDILINELKRQKQLQQQVSGEPEYMGTVEAPRRLVESSTASGIVEAPRRLAENIGANDINKKNVETKQN